MRILVIGGSGVFGSRLAEGLARDGFAGRLVVAGRSPAPLKALAERLGCAALALDRDAPDLDRQVAEAAPLVVIDAAGPFQTYGGRDPYKLARAALAAGAHYIDLSDDAGFASGITALDAEARQRVLVAISGASSVPALSAAAVRALADDLVRIDLIDSVILPGNRAPRGRSVMAAILAQAGKPLPGGCTGWIGAARVTIETGDGIRLRRLASPIGAPDLTLFPRRFKAGEVRFRAGLELAVLHRGLAFIAHLVRLGLLRSEVPLLGVLHPLARLFEPFGTDTGAMRVTLRGATTSGATAERRWTLVASAGKGPYVPAIPARILVRRLSEGTLAPGARPCLDDFTLADTEAAAPELNLKFHLDECPFSTVFTETLGPQETRLPEPIRDLHHVIGTRRWSGMASVQRGRSPLARLVGWLFRFPAEAAEVPVTVTMRHDGGTETWTRDFAGARFRSHLRADPGKPGRVWERFGPFSFAIDLKADDTTLAYPIAAGRFLGLPLPHFMLPASDTVEAVDAAGRATFDVAISLPFAGHIVRYRGWLLPDQPISGDQDEAEDL